MTKAEQLLGQHIKQVREALGISQEELAHRAGIHTSYMSRLERGRQSPSFGVLLELGKALETPASTLVSAVEQGLRETST